MDDNVAAGRRKKCGRCGEFKPLSAFHRRGEGHQWYCRPCRKAWDAAYWARRRDFRVEQQRDRRRQLREWIRDLKSSQPCIDCGGRFHWVAMTYDHLPGSTKRGEISNLVAGGYRSVLLSEMAKCELVCANCHAVRTYMRAIRVGIPAVEEEAIPYTVDELSAVAVSA